MNTVLASNSDEDLKAGGVEGAVQDGPINLMQSDSDDESYAGVKYEPPALVTQYEDDSNDDENDNGGEESLADAISITDDGRRYPTCRRMEPDRNIPLAKGPTHRSSRQMAGRVVSDQIESIKVSYDEDARGNATVQDSDRTHRGNKLELAGVGYPAVQPEGVRGRIDLKEQYYGANQSYSTSQGVLNLNFNESAPLPMQMSETQTDEYIVGFVFAQNFNLKKGLELFGDAADVAVKKELSQIHELSTYEPLALS